MFKNKFFHLKYKSDNDIKMFYLCVFFFSVGGNITSGGRNEAFSVFIFIFLFGIIRVILSHY